MNGTKCLYITICNEIYLDKGQRDIEVKLVAYLLTNHCDIQILAILHVSEKFYTGIIKYYSLNINNGNVWVSTLTRIKFKIILNVKDKEFLCPHLYV
jgi:hypothetical protein